MCWGGGRHPQEFIIQVLPRLLASAGLFKCGVSHLTSLTYKQNITK